MLSLGRDIIKTVEEAAPWYPHSIIGHVFMGAVAVPAALRHDVVLPLILMHRSSNQPFVAWWPVLCLDFDQNDDLRESTRKS